MLDTIGWIVRGGRSSKPPDRGEAYAGVLIRLLLLLAIAYVAAAVYCFVLPHDDKPMPADAVVVLAGTESRLPVGERLVREGYAPLLVVSLEQPPTTSERRACARGALCFHASPYSTRGEAREIGRLAALRHWRAVDVVTSRFHVFRARILIRRCYHGALHMVGAPQSGLHLPIDAVEESAKLAYQLTIARSC